MDSTLTMKVAAITDDGKTISQHFGHARYYLVLSIANGRIISRELHEKLGHNNFANEVHIEIPGQPHGMDQASHDKHLRMSENISDCEVLLCRGMGRGAYESMKARGIRPVVTDIAAIDEAALAYANNKIIDHIERLH